MATQSNPGDVHTVHRIHDVPAPCLWESLGSVTEVNFTLGSRSGKRPRPVAQSPHFSASPLAAGSHRELMGPLPTQSSQKGGRAKARLYPAGRCSVGWRREERRRGGQLSKPGGRRSGREGSGPPEAHKQLGKNEPAGLRATTGLQVCPVQ